jgi:hypothetical protein
MDYQAYQHLDEHQPATSITPSFGSYDERNNSQYTAEITQELILNLIGKWLHM